MNFLNLLNEHRELMLAYRKVMNNENLGSHVDKGRMQLFSFTKRKNGSCDITPLSAWVPVVDWSDFMRSAIAEAQA